MNNITQGNHIFAVKNRTAIYNPKGDNIGLKLAPFFGCIHR